MISCKEATDFISKKEEGKLTIMQRYALWRHLLICTMCRLFNLQNKTIVKNASTLRETDASLTREEKDGIIQTLNQ
ncbi:MAG: hypothetical protein C0459_06480 [Chitinophaga sp.]|jgi:hypothetical protein|nr:hypothetical protein [Chitinophaga sp.]